MFVRPYRWSNHGLQMAATLLSHLSSKLPPSEWQHAPSKTRCRNSTSPRRVLELTGRCAWLHDSGFGTCNSCCLRQSCPINSPPKSHSYHLSLLRHKHLLDAAILWPVFFLLWLCTVTLVPGGKGSISFIQKNFSDDVYTHRKASTDTKHVKFTYTHLCSEPEISILETRTTATRLSSAAYKTYLFVLSRNVICNKIKVLLVGQVCPPFLSYLSLNSWHISLDD
jgi:hypothetical protein